MDNYSEFWLKKACGVGLHSYRYPIEYGGGGAEGLVTECLVTEELAWGCAGFNLARDYTKERVQFGRPIARQQAIGFMLADTAMAVDAARLLVWRAASLADQGQSCNFEGSQAKCFAADTAMKVTTAAVRILGGYGYMREYPAEKWMRDAKIMQIFEGTNQIQRVVMAGAITG